MASSNKVFVSPGVYTSERDLTFVAQSVGVTTLGIVGETIQGPAFEPIFITNFDEFQVYFGGTSPEKFVNTQIPKYESSYIAKAYLSQSNQLFVTRILGLSGYDAGPSWSVVTIANPNPATIAATGNTTGITLNFTGTTGTSGNITITSIPSQLSADFNSTYTTFNGGTSTLNADFQNFISTNVNRFSVSASTSATTAIYWGTLSANTLTYVSGSSVNTVTATSETFGVNNVNLSLANLSAGTNDTWYYALFDNTGNGNYTGFSFYSYIDNVGVTTTSSNCASFYSFSVGGSVLLFEGVISGGTGYVDGSGLGTTTITGVGAGLTVEISTDGGSVIGAITNCEGSGYEVGDIIQINQGGSGEDAYLTINPQITFFKKIFYRHTQFATELQVIYPDQQPEFNSNISFTINIFWIFLGLIYCHC
jgi:hypothetical protein